MTRTTGELIAIAATGAFVCAFVFHIVVPIVSYLR
jgi:hypothetical protein